MLKIDAEGHEPAVLAGAARLLRTRAIRDIVFEDHRHGSASQPLLAAGYSVFALGCTFLASRLHPQAV